MAATFLMVRENRAKTAHPTAAQRAAFKKSFLEVRMFNVGGGEAILLIFPDKRAWLVDGGSSNSNPRNQKLGEALAGYFKARGLILDALVPSHPHVDHVGAVSFLLRAKPKLSKTVRYFFCDDPTWHLEREWIDDLEGELAKLASPVEKVSLRSAHREIDLADSVEAHLFAGSGDGAYTSVFLHLHFGAARLLFTGDSHCLYELNLVGRFGENDFRSDVLKVTHHGSSSGTAQGLVDAVKPGIVVASTAQDDGHRLERDTLERLGGRPGPRAVFETQIDGDIILRTDGKAQGGGILYEVEFEKPGRFAEATGATIRPLADVDKARTIGKHPECN